MDEVELVGWAAVRIINLQALKGDAKTADEVLELLRGGSAVRTATGRGRVGVGVVGFSGRLEDAVEIARRVLSAPAAPPAALGWAVFAGGLALGLMGLGDQVAALAQRGRAIENHVDGVLRHLMAYAEVRALVLLGDFDAAEKRSADTCNSLHPANTCAGGLPTSGRHRRPGPRPVRRGGIADGTDRRGADHRVGGLVELSQIAFGPSLLRTRPRRGGGGDHRRTSKPHWWARRRWRPQLRIAEAWLAAAQGNVSGAIATAIDAAELAGQADQLAIEMLALHDAARFGDRTSLQRLIDVAGSVDGRLARVRLPGMEGR